MRARSGHAAMVTAARTQSAVHHTLPIALPMLYRFILTLGATYEADTIIIPISRKRKPRHEKAKELLPEVLEFKNSRAQI